MTPEDLKQKVDDLIRRTDAFNKKKAGVGGQLEAKKEELATLIKEIRAAGHDPKNLASERDKAEQDLKEMVVAYEKDLVAAEHAIVAFDKK